MGSRGPIPKRAEERRRRNKESAVETVTAAGNVKPTTCPSGLHAEAKGWFQSLSDSGQSKFYEPSDWRQARVLAIILDGMLEAPRVSAQMFAAWCSAASELGTTEGARRRVHIEIDRKPNKPKLAQVTAIDEYRDLRG